MQKMKIQAQRHFSHEGGRRLYMMAPKLSGVSRGCVLGWEGVGNVPGLSCMHRTMVEMLQVQWMDY